MTIFAKLPKFHGSPPRAWGRRIQPHHFRIDLRFTPTCVGKTAGNRPCRARRPVHPHVRGEDVALYATLCREHGSPPRAWGRRNRPGRTGGRRRFTPTCVGKTRERASVRGRNTVHPHVRGEDAIAPAGDIHPVGSPPRAWGRHGHVAGVENFDRFTPTCVGKTARRNSFSFPTTVHPHVRGEDCFTQRCEVFSVGSPPRAWGRLLLFAVFSSFFAVHPHVRGEDKSPAPPLVYDDGSPPRAWGRLYCQDAPHDRARFTPTCVGKTLVTASVTFFSAVHPHVRGEDAHGDVRCDSIIGSPPRAWGRRATLQAENVHPRFTPTCVGKTFSTCITILLYSGSPPRAWGRPRANSNRGVWRRFTPTCVGKTPVSLSPTRLTTVHPHVRGEDRMVRGASVSYRGSPPRAWGRLCSPCHHASSVRFTPTCVGKTGRRDERIGYHPVHPHVRGEDREFCVLGG